MNKENKKVEKDQDEFTTALDRLKELRDSKLNYSLVTDESFIESLKGFKVKALLEIYPEYDLLIDKKVDESAFSLLTKRYHGNAFVKYDESNDFNKSALQWADTVSKGRAIAAAGFGIEKGMATKEEVELAKKTPNITVDKEKVVTTIEETQKRLEDIQANKTATKQDDQSVIPDMEQKPQLPTEDPTYAGKTLVELFKQKNFIKEELEALKDADQRSHLLAIISSIITPTYGFVYGDLPAKRKTSTLDIKFILAAQEGEDTYYQWVLDHWGESDKDHPLVVKAREHFEGTPSENTEVPEENVESPEEKVSPQMESGSFEQPSNSKYSFISELNESGKRDDASVLMKEVLAVCKGGPMGINQAIKDIFEDKYKNLGEFFVQATVEDVTTLYESFI